MEVDKCPVNSRGPIRRTSCSLRQKWNAKCRTRRGNSMRFLLCLCYLKLSHCKLTQPFGSGPKSICPTTLMPTQSELCAHIIVETGEHQSMLRPILLVTPTRCLPETARTVKRPQTRLKSSLRQRDVRRSLAMEVFSTVDAFGAGAFGEPTTDLWRQLRLSCPFRLTVLLNLP